MLYPSMAKEFERLALSSVDKCEHIVPMSEFVLNPVVFGFVCVPLWLIMIASSSTPDPKQTVVAPVCNPFCGLVIIFCYPILFIRYLLDSAPPPSTRFLGVLNDVLVTHCCLPLKFPKSKCVNAGSGTTQLVRNF